MARWSRHYTFNPRPAVRTRKSWSFVGAVMRLKEGLGRGGDSGPRPGWLALGRCAQNKVVTQNKVAKTSGATGNARGAMFPEDLSTGEGCLPPRDHAIRVLRVRQWDETETSAHQDPSVLRPCAVRDSRSGERGARRAKEAVTADLGSALSNMLARAGRRVATPGGSWPLLVAKLETASGDARLCDHGILHAGESAPLTAIGRAVRSDCGLALAAAWPVLVQRGGAAQTRLGAWCGGAMRPRGRRAPHNARRWTCWAPGSKAWGRMRAIRADHRAPKLGRLATDSRRS